MERALGVIGVTTYRKILCKEMLLDEVSLQNAMFDRDYWKKITR